MLLGLDLLVLGLLIGLRGLYSLSEMVRAGLEALVYGNLDDAIFLELLLLACFCLN